MRTRPPTRLLLLIAPLVSACGTDDTGVHLIDGFVERSAGVQCRSASTMRRHAVADAVAVGDTAFLVLYPDAREVVVYDDRLRPRRTIPFAAEGPTGVVDPVSAAVVGDSVVYIADRGRRALRRLDLDGQDRGLVRLPFTPHRVRPGPQGVLVSPVVLGEEPPWLLYRLRPDTPPIPVRVPPTRYTDMTVNALANMVIPALSPDGELLLVHEFLVPAAFRASAPGARPRRVALPLPDGVRSTIGHVPTTPITEDGMARMTMSALAMAVDSRTGDVLYVTRTGRRRGETSEKTVIRVDPSFAYRRSYLLDVNAAHLVYLSRRALSLVVNEEDAWHICPTP